MALFARTGLRLDLLEGLLGAESPNATEEKVQAILASFEKLIAQPAWRIELRSLSTDEEVLAQVGLPRSAGAARPEVVQRLRDAFVRSDQLLLQLCHICAEKLRGQDPSIHEVNEAIPKLTLLRRQVVACIEELSNQEARELFRQGWESGHDPMDPLRDEMLDPLGYLDERYLGHTGVYTGPSRAKGEYPYEVGDAVVSMLLLNLSLRQEHAGARSLLMDWKEECERLRESQLGGEPRERSNLIRIRETLFDHARAHPEHLKIQKSYLVPELVERATGKSKKVVLAFAPSVQLALFAEHLQTHIALVEAMAQAELKDQTPSVFEEITRLREKRQRSAIEATYWADELRSLMRWREDRPVTAEFVAECADALDDYAALFQSEFWVLFGNPMPDGQPFLSVTAGPLRVESEAPKDEVMLELIRLAQAEERAVHGTGESPRNPIDALARDPRRPRRPWGNDNLLVSMFLHNIQITVKTLEGFDALGQPHGLWMTPKGPVLIHHSMTDQFPKPSPDVQLRDLLQSRASRAKFWDEIHAASGSPHGPD